MITQTYGRQFRPDPGFAKALKAMDEARYAYTTTAQSRETIVLIKYQAIRGMSRTRMVQIWGETLVRAAEEQIAAEKSTESHIEATLAATYGPVQSRHQEIAERRSAALGRQK